MTAIGGAYRPFSSPYDATFREQCRFCLHINGPHVDDADFKQHLHGGANFGIDASLLTLKAYALSPSAARAAFSDMRGQNHLKQTLLFMPAAPQTSSAPQWSALFRAPEGKRDRSPQRPGRPHLQVARRDIEVFVHPFRDDEHIETERQPAGQPGPCFGVSAANCSSTTSRSWRTSSDRMERIAPRYILRLTFWLWSCGRAAKVVPPPRQIGLRMEPAGPPRSLAARACGHRREPPPAFLCPGALPRAGEVGHHHLVHQGFVELTPEGRF